MPALFFLLLVHFLPQMSPAITYFVERLFGISYARMLCHVSSLKSQHCINALWFRLLKSYGFDIDLPRWRGLMTNLTSSNWSWGWNFYYLPDSTLILDTFFQPQSQKTEVHRIAYTRQRGRVICTPVVRRCLGSILFSLAHGTIIVGQSINTTLQKQIETALEEQIETAIENETTTGQSYSFDLLSDLTPNSIDLNSDQVELLIELQILTPIHLRALYTYREVIGDLISVYELQAVPHFDVHTIRELFPYVSVNLNSTEMQLPFWAKLKHGSSELMIRWGRILEKQPAYDPAASTSQFKGNNSRLYFRYSYQTPGKFYVGLTGEKDPGEELFKGSNPYGFDFYSYHLYIKKYKSWLPIIALGDYSISMGHGLILNSGFTLGKSALTTRLISARSTIRRYTSVGEDAFFRGIAFQIKPHKNISATFFFSRKKHDASVRTDTTIADNGNIQIDKIFSSLQASGNHRSESERANRNKVHQTSSGGSIQFRKKQYAIALNLVRRSFDLTIIPSPKIYTLNRFSGNRISNVSMSYNYSLLNFYFFGETAMGQNKKLSSVNGILLTLDKKIDIAVHTRIIPGTYQQFEARTFGESSTAENETGIYIGTEIRPFEKWTINAYSDFWKHKRPGFNVNGPSQGNEQLLRITYHKRHHSTFYIQYRHETKDKNSSINDIRIDHVVPHNRQYLRIHFSHKSDAGIELRNRIEFSFYQEKYQETRKGVLIYQDVIYKPIETAFTFTGRVAFFDTDDYLSRIYAYENDLSYQFSVPAYTYRGVRYYLNLRYSGLQNVTVEGRIAQLRLYDRDQIGSGNLQINGNTKTEVKFQFRIRF